MRTVNSLLRISAKFQFKKIRKQKIFCACLNQQIYISKKLFYHIANSRARSIKEVAERLAILPLIPYIAEKGEVSEVRKHSRKISLKINRHTLSVVLMCEHEQLIAISCFRDTKQKSNLS